MSEVLVRRCYACGEPSMVVVRDWAETAAFGIKTGASAQKDWVCQSCGKRMIQRSRLFSIVMAVTLLPMITCMAPTGLTIVGLAEGSWLLLPFAPLFFIVGVAILYATLRPAIRQARSPIQKDAPPPFMNFPDAVVLRKCTCGGTAACTKIVMSRSNGIPMGVEETFQCTSCNKEFVIESPLGAVSTILGGLICFGLVALCGFGSSEFDWLTIGAMALAGLLGVAAFAIAIARFTARVRHPVIPLTPGRG